MQAKADFSIRRAEMTELQRIETAKNEYRLILFSEGNGYFQLRDTIHDFFAGDCLLLRVSSELSLVPGFRQTCRFTEVAFRQEDILPGCFQPAALGIIDDYLNTPAPATYLALKKDDFSVAVCYAAAIYHQEDTLPHSCFLVQHTLSALIFFLARALTLSSAKKRQGNREISSRDTMLELVKHYIHQNYSESLSLSVIADYVYANPSYLSRVFKEKNSMPLSAYINRVRIENAKRLLLDTDDLIIDIALACGYNYIPHFNRIFKEVTEETPSQYRRLHRVRSY